MTTRSRPRNRHRRRITQLAVLAGIVVLSGATQAQALPADRAAALEAWLDLNDSTSVRSGWTGTVAGCIAGSESQTSLDATLGALNTIRDFAGVAPVTFDPVLNQKALKAALMMRAANDLSHGPGPTWPCYSSDGAAAANNSNLAMYAGLTGATAITKYIEDLGHGGPMLDPRRTAFGSGTTDAPSGQVTNALYLRGASAPSASVPEVVAWPPPGNVPWPLINGQWYALIDVAGDVDASAVAVHVSVGGRAMAVSGVVGFSSSMYATSADRLGAMVEWDVSLAQSERDANATIDVTLDGITVDGVPRQFSYSIDTIRAQPPTQSAPTGSRTANSVTIAWQAAVERGVPVTGYRVVGRDNSGLVLDHVAGPADRSVTLPYSAPANSVSIWVTPISRLAVVAVQGIALAPPASPAPIGTWRPPLAFPVGALPATPAAAVSKGSRARFVGRVTLRLLTRGRARVGSRLTVSADVRGESKLRYRWRNNGRAMSGATRRSYTIRRPDRGRRITCRVTAVGSDGVSVARTSSARLSSASLRGSRTAVACATAVSRRDPQAIETSRPDPPARPRDDLRLCGERRLRRRRRAREHRHDDGAVGELPHAGDPAADEDHGRDPARGAADLGAMLGRQHRGLLRSRSEHVLIEAAEQPQRRARHALAELVGVLGEHPARLAGDVDARQPVAHRLEPPANDGLPEAVARQPSVEGLGRRRAVGAEIRGDDDGRSLLRLRQAPPPGDRGRRVRERDLGTLTGAVTERALPGERLEQRAPPGAQRLLQMREARIGDEPRDELVTRQRDAVEDLANGLGERADVVRRRAGVALPDRPRPGLREAISDR